MVVRVRLCRNFANSSSDKNLHVSRADPGLDRCPDRELPAFERYVALAIVARNLQILGRYIQQQERDLEKERCPKERCQKAA